MPRDARLDDFDSSTEESGNRTQTEESDGTASAGKSTASAASEDSNGTEEPSPAPGDDSAVVLTTVWTPEGATCATCGETVERRWRMDGALVCAECKTWDDA